MVTIANQIFTNANYRANTVFEPCLLQVNTHGEWMERKEEQRVKEV